MKKSVNFNGYATPASRARRDARASSAKALVATFRALGMTDAEIIEAVKRVYGQADEPTPTTEQESK